jgi:hypothetical protein
MPPASAIGLNFNKPHLRSSSVLYHSSRNNENSARFIAWSLYCLLAYPLYLSIFIPETGVVSIKRLGSLIILNCGLLCLCYAGVIEYRKKASFSLSKTTRVLLFIIISWGLITIVRSLQLNIRNITWLFGYPLAGGAWIIPVAAIVGTQKSCWEYLGRIFFTHTTLGVFIQCLNLGTLIGTGSALIWVYPGTLAYATPILLFTWHKNKAYITLISFSGLFLYCIDSMVQLVRSGVGLSIYYMFCFFCIVLLSKCSVRQRMRIIIPIIFIVLPLFFLCIMLIPTDTVRIKAEAFSEKFLLDTRSAGLLEFIEQTSGKELIIGRGALGRYYSYYFEAFEPDGRVNIECGYLQIVHKSGLVMLMPFLILTISAVIQGLFDSKNNLTKAAALIVLGRLLYMIVHGLPSVDPTYVLFWLAVGACLNKKLRYADVNLFNNNRTAVSRKML